MPNERYVTFWRKLGEECLDWGHHVSFSFADAEQVVANLKKRGIREYHTAPLGEGIPELSYPLPKGPTDVH